jgi:hypothetical protein
MIPSMPDSTLKILFFSLLFFSFTEVLSQGPGGIGQKDTAITKKEHMGFFELNIGADTRHATGLLTSIDGSGRLPYAATAVGLTGRMQSSFIGNILFPGKERKFKAFDLLTGELSLGGLTTGNPNETSGTWLAYRFDFGGGMVYRLNEHNDMGLGLMLLKFARDKVSPNISGSGIALRYRCYKMQAEAGVEARRERMFGYLMKDAPVQWTAALRYLFNGKKSAGIKMEMLSGSRNFLKVGNIEVHQVWSLRLFYGIYF